MKNYFQFEGKYQLESGKTLNGLHVAYSLYGNPQADKTIWVCHALSGSSEVLDWWPGLFGEGQLFSSDDYKIICANVIGGCYGSTGPLSYEKPIDFPDLTVRDIVGAHQLLAEALKVKSIDILIGASLGGQQALEWSITDSKLIKSLILIATNAEHSPLGRAFNESQRLALKADPTFGQSKGGRDGLKAARAIAMLSYRSYEDFKIKQADTGEELLNYRAASYVRYQGEKFVERFDPYSYFILSQAMDSHDVKRGRGELSEVLGGVSTRTLVVGIDSDTLFPLSEQRLLAELLPNADLGVISSPYGHDAFLIEYEQLSELIADFLFNEFKGHKQTTLKPKQLILSK